jgi:2-oxoglutarate dehydrogenase E2 component (dihydrolipoamide succinyltransferase)
MTIEVVVPDLGESVMEATVARWIRQEGEQVQIGEPLVELETDKANLEVSAERSGRVEKIERREGEDVKVGEVLAILEEAAGEEIWSEEGPTPC